SRPRLARGPARAGGGGASVDRRRRPQHRRHRQHAVRGGRGAEGLARPGRRAQHPGRRGLPRPRAAAPVSARPRAAAPRRPARRESAADRAARTRLILRRLKRAYPDARCALDHADAYQLLVATILSAQCTDARVNLVTPAFFARWPDAAALAAARPAEVEEVVRSTGFFRNKARNLVAMAQALEAGHGGEVPASMEALRVLPGVGRKTANVVLGNAFGIDEGITVDTH